MKKLSLVAMTMCVALALSGCFASDIGDFYQSAQLYLGRGEYAAAADLFAQLGEYRDSAEYALYCRALAAMQAEEYAVARANLAAVEPFKSSARYLEYLDALEAEKAGDLEAALALYEKLGTFANSHLEAERLRKDIPEAAMKEGRALMARGDYEAARELFRSLQDYGNSQSLADNCTAALNRAARDAAESLAEAGDKLGALAAYRAMGDTLDALKRAEEIRGDILAELEKQYAAVTLATAPALIDAYAALGEDEAALSRIAALNERFGRNLRLLTMKAPLVQLGVYPYAESGEEHPVRWLVIKVEGSLLTLLSEQVLDASAEASAVPVDFDEKEKPAAGEVMLPSMTELAAVPDLICEATPYAMAQGAQNPAAYWLRDSLENGVHPIIGAAGTMALPQEDEVIGVRPMVVIDLEKINFTQGDGSAEAPFRVE
ncbi:MAG: hypothetical protein IKL25_03160 [Clostridia bacterium]|nr:hypothetical protein [Clostridia bacterium]